MSCDLPLSVFHETLSVYICNIAEETDGAKFEYDIFWDAFQNYGNRTYYPFGFDGSNPNIGLGMLWNNKTFRPKYDMRPEDSQYMFRSLQVSGDFVELLDDIGVVFDTSNSRNMSQMFLNANALTRLGVIDFTSSGRGNQMQAFAGCSCLKKIDKLVAADTGEIQSFYLTFQQCTALENITVDGILNPNGTLTFQWSPLTVDSMKSIISHLKNCKGTSEEYTNKVTFTEDCWKKLNAEGNTSPNGNTWREYVEYDLCWTT